MRREVESRFDDDGARGRIPLPRTLQHVYGERRHVALLRPRHPGRKRVDIVEPGRVKEDVQEQGLLAPAVRSMEDRLQPRPTDREAAPLVAEMRAPPPALRHPPVLRAPMGHRAGA